MVGSSPVGFVDLRVYKRMYWASEIGGRLRWARHELFM